MQEVAIDTPMGKVYVRSSASGIQSVTFGKSGVSRTRRPTNKIKQRSGDGKAITARFKSKLRDYLAGDLRALSKLPVDPQGTEFQQRVWKELKRIPAGKTLTYAQIAKRVGRPKASRAVGNACGKNPVCLVIPCHRVVGSANQLGGFSAGLSRKRFLLRHENIKLPR